MWASIFRAITKLFNGFGTLAEAFDNTAHAANEIALMGRESATALHHESRITRVARDKALLLEHGVTADEVAVLSDKA